jgi:hypothetical protein
VIALESLEKILERPVEKDIYEEDVLGFQEIEKKEEESEHE